jgi:hypothetical protein
MPSEFLLPPRQESEGSDSRGKPSPSPHTCMFHLLSCHRVRGPEIWPTSGLIHYHNFPMSVHLPQIFSDYFIYPSRVSLLDGLFFLGKFYTERLPRST